MKDLITTENQESFRDRLRKKLKEKSKDFEPASDEQSGEQSGERCLLLDVSSSMCGEPIQKLREAARDFQSSMRRFAYNDTCWEIPRNQGIPDPGYGTLDYIAFEHLKSKNIKHVIMITDGGSSSPNRSLEAAIGLKIDIIYIGPPPRPQFLEDLAKATGGSFDNIKFDSNSAAKLLNAKIKGLLPAPKTGAIQL